MALKNDFSIDTIVLNSQVQSQDFASRIYSNARGNRTNLTQSIQQWKSNNATRQAYRFPLDTPKYYMTIDISDYVRNDLFSLNFNSMFTIVLPMPNQLISHNAVAYDTVEIGTTTGLVGNSLWNTAGKNLMTNIQNGSDLKSTLSQLGDSLFNPDAQAAAERQTAFGTSLGVAAGQVLAPKPLENAAQALAGYSPNQFFTVLLRGPTYNQYQFQWYLLPRNLRESNQIKDITNILNNAKAPGLALNGALWKFPKVFKLAYYPNIQYLNKFKPAVMTDFQVNFAPGGTPAFYATNGTPNPPEAVVIAAQFTELEYWLEGDYIDDNNPDSIRGARG